MQPDARTYLWDAVEATHRIERFSFERTYEDYETDELLRSAVERQFEVVGEALNQLSKRFPEIASRVPDLARIIAFRNLLIHGYAAVDDAVVCQIRTERLPELARVLE
ncbi:DUF86 domain-containing protein [Skermania sp. ID1734]|uniref:HepT-like ribonuclease domain-containing protein n=1 Tax=Skermania sp. ID1734 TaxID=2597516 RepID=UPI0011813C3F|nr:HepT-like ribonuclease domain-containing protein [Skermania sp. ID1734]TSD97211.1 DUF86 domain-containing protein [Skermania sp. ID1734]